MSLTNSQGKLILSDNNSNLGIFPVSSSSLATGGINTGIVTSGLISYWGLNESGVSSGDIKDSAYSVFGVGSNPGNHGTRFGTAPITSSGIFGNAHQFNGDDYVSITNQTPFNFERTDAFSFSMWFNDSSVPAAFAETMLSKIQQASPFIGWQLWLTDRNGPVSFEFSIAQSPGTAIMITGTGGISSYFDGGWHNVACTYDGSSTPSGMKLYVDGSLFTTSSTGSASLSATVQNAVNLNIGSAEAGARPFSAFVDEVLVYNVELTSGQVLQNYNVFI